MIESVKSKVTDFYLKHGMKINGALMAVPVSVSTMTLQASAEEATSSDISGTVDTILTCLGKGYTWIMSQPVLATCFVSSIVGALIFGNIKKAKRAVK